MQEKAQKKAGKARALLDRGWLSDLFWLALFAGVAAFLHFHISFPSDDDTAYHFAVSRLMARHGILHSFPWATFSWQLDHYADKEFLFHVLFLPLGKSGFATASRVVGTIGVSAILASLYFVLRAERVRYAGVWALLPLTSSVFVFRIAQVRPHLFSIALAIVVVWAIARGRLALLFLVSLLYPLAYVAFWQIPLILLIAVESSRLLGGEKVRWQPAATVAGGIAVGLLLHPNALHLIQINWIHMSDILFRTAWGENLELKRNLGSEFNPYSLLEWEKFLAVVVVMGLAALAAGWKERRRCSIPLAFALAAIAFGILTVKTNRFLEYLVPFSALSLATAAGSLPVKRFLAPAVMAVSLLYMLAVGMQPYRIMATHGPFIDQVTANYFRSIIPEGAQVFNTAWDQTGQLLVALPERRFIVAEDPTLFFKKNPALYKIWYHIPLDAPLDSAEAIRRLFKSRYVISANVPAYVRFFDLLSADPSVKTLFANERWVLFDLGTPPLPSATSSLPEGRL